MPYSVKECFYTLQGEGARSGRAAVFCRFSGCNLWSGREQDRATALCDFCDTDFRGTDGDGGGRFDTAAALAAHVAARWAPADRGADRPDARPYVVCTGGEPLLQLDTALIDALHARGFEVAVESNGSLPAPVGVDWVCVSPKADVPLGADPRRRAEAGLSAAIGAAGALRAAGFRPMVPATDGRSGVGRKHRGGDRLLHGPSTLAARAAGA
jgi:7-carboxy-7-deazaguanine synthase (Cx14CxxC type)